MVRKSIFFVLLAFSFSLVSGACASSKHSGKKCDGRKGQRTPMGNI